MQLRSILAPILRAFRFHRRWFAAIFAALAVVTALTVLSTPNDGVPVVIAARDLAPGTTLSSQDLSIVRVPHAIAAHGSMTATGEAIGHEVVVGLPAGTILNTTFLLSSTTNPEDGKTILPVRFSDESAAAILSIGAHIDILGTTTGGVGYSVIAANVRVAALPRGANSGPMTSQSSGLALVEVDQAQAAALVAAASNGSLSYALR